MRGALAPEGLGVQFTIARRLHAGTLDRVTASRQVAFPQVIRVSEGGLEGLLPSPCGGFIVGSRAVAASRLTSTMSPVADSASSPASALAVTR